MALDIRVVSARRRRALVIALSDRVAPDLLRSIYLAQISIQLDETRGAIGARRVRGIPAPTMIQMQMQYDMMRVLTHLAMDGTDDAMWTSYMNETGVRSVAFLAIENVRHSGGSMAVCMFIAALMYTIPGMAIIYRSFNTPSHVMEHRVMQFIDQNRTNIIFTSDTVTPETTRRTCHMSGGSSSLMCARANEDDKIDKEPCNLLICEIPPMIYMHVLSRTR
jgi:hypothetical protein